MKDYEDALLKVTLHSIDNTNAKHRAIDHKAISIITISGILAGFVISFGEPSVLNYLTAFAFIGTIFLTMPVLEPRKIDELSPLMLINHLDDDNKDGYNTSITIGTAAEYDDDLREICSDKGQQLWNSVKVLAASVFLLLLNMAMMYYS